MTQRGLLEDSVSRRFISHNSGMNSVGDSRKSVQFIASKRSSSLVAGVFSVKLETVIKDATKNGVFGQMKVNVYTIEFQKRGLEKRRR
jgi:hypothetical protein